MMEAALTKLITMLASYGPGFVIAAIVILFGYLDRKAHKEALAKEREINEKLSDKLMQLAADSIKSDTEHTATLQAMMKVLDSVDRRLS